MAEEDGRARGRMALLPLDDRPVNIQLPQDVAAICGVELATPPPELLPAFRDPGDPEPLAGWLIDQSSDEDTGHAVVSLDMLCYGGLIAGRTSADSVETALRRLSVLEEIRSRRPGLRLSAVSLVMRASDSYSATEEPDYWSTYGRDLHHFGADVHRRDGEQDAAPVPTMARIPPAIVSDLAGRRLRNHIVNLTAVRMVDAGVVDFLAMTADDTAPYSFGSAEQAWIRHWLRLFPGAHRVLSYPGADEVGAVLVARALAESVGVKVRIGVQCADVKGMQRIAPFENVPLGEAIARQVAAAGAVVDSDDADLTVVVHAPDPQRHDQASGIVPPVDAKALEQTVSAVRAGLATGRRVAIADVRYANGADAALVEALASDGSLDRLTSFGGWNTAGNTIGSVVATGCAAVIGERTGRLDEEAVRRALIRRILDDYAFQSRVRREGDPAIFGGAFVRADAAVVAGAERWVRDRMAEILADDLPFKGWAVSRVTLPWSRGFEVEVDVARNSENVADSAGEPHVRI